MQNLPKWLIQAIAGLLAILLVVFIIGKMVEIGSVNRGLANKQTITISAEGRATGVPDLATINASVVSEGSTAEIAQKQATEKTNQVMTFIESQGIDKKDVQTSSYNVFPKYDYNNGTQKLNGYMANQSVTVKVRKADAVGKLLDGLTNNGVNQIQGVSYSFDDPDGLKQQAREEALKNAKDKAQRLADVAGVRLGKLVSFSESVNNPSYPMPMFNAMPASEARDAAQTSIVEPGTQEIVANVNVIYEIK